MGGQRLRVRLTSLSDLSATGVLAIKSGNEEDRIATDIYLIVDRSLREKGTLPFGQGIADEASAVLFDEPGFHLSVHEVKDLVRSWVGVR